MITHQYITQRRFHQHGFTLVEMLVVVSVIIILMGLVITVGVRVVGGQKESQTTGVLRTLDRSLEEYYTDAEAFPKFSLQAYRNIQGPKIVAPIALEQYVNTNIRTFGEGDDNRKYPARPTVAVFLEQVRGFGSVDQIIESLPNQFIRSMQRPLEAHEQDGGYLRVADAWDNEIFFIHPDNALAQELYGRCTNRRPYFLSSGQDEAFGFTVELPQGAIDVETYNKNVLEQLDDNLASTPIGPANRTSAFFDAYRIEL